MPKIQTLMKKRKKTYQCNNCNVAFRHIAAWKDHVVLSDPCKSSHYPCIHYNKQYIGYEEKNLLQHYN